MGNSTDGHGAAGELLPCPFCGCQVTDADVDDENEYTAFTPYYRVVCLGCGSMCDGHEDCGAAVMNWNRRASVPNTGTALSVREMQAINARRSARWMAGSPGWTTLEIAGELAGEVGELANVCKKLRRSEMGVPGNKVSDEVLFQQARGEMADVMIVLMLTASKLGIDLQDAVCATFNAKSEQMGFPERLSSAPSRGSDSELIDWLESEHARVDPVARLVVKQRHDRNSGEWADVSHDVRGTLQSLAGDTGKPEPRRLRQVRPHTPGPGYICGLCNASHVLGCRDGRIDNARCPSAPLVTESAGGQKP